MSPEETKAYLKERASLLDQLVIKFLDEEKSYAGTVVSPVAREVLEFAESACLGGKRLRGTFVMTAAEMLGCGNTEVVQQIATITELIHSAILVFDDVIDDSPLRHNSPTVHFHYFEKYQQKPNAFLFGQGVALSIALVLEHIVFERVSMLNLPDAVKVKLYAHLHRAFANTGYGELLDVYSFVYDNPSEEHILKVLDFKTARYTYEMPLHTGAILAGAGEKEMQIIHEYSKYGGIAFQVIDDILGVFGTAEAIGKSPLSDIQEGKKTILISHVLANGTAAQKNIIQRHLGNKQLTLDDLDEVKTVLTDVGSVDYARKMARDLMQTSNTIIEKQREVWNAKSVDFLLGLNEYVLTRNK
jgi:geranylgeranyl diphosphate synthase type II